MKTKTISLLIVAAALVLASIAYANGVVKRYQGTHVFEVAKAQQFRPFRHSSTITASGDIDLADLKAASVFLVSTTAPGAATLDLDIGDDAAITSDMVGQAWDFVILTGSSAFTVTAGATGFTTVTTIDLKGTTCEDAGDTIRCQARSTSAVTCFRSCAD